MSDFQVVVAELGGESYGLPIEAVYEIIRLQPITAVPKAPAFVEGVINLRGRIVPVVDLARRFGLLMADRGKANRIVVAAVGGTRVGLVVDAVSEVLLIDEGAVEPTPPVAAGVDAAYVRGIARLDDRLVILLQLDGLFGDVERDALRAA
jgi:purine-binding chemotaxis protein CheW